MDGKQCLLRVPWMRSAAFFTPQAQWGLIKYLEFFIKKKGILTVSSVSSSKKTKEDGGHFDNNTRGVRSAARRLNLSTVEPTTSLLTVKTHPSKVKLVLNLFFSQNIVYSGS